MKKIMMLGVVTLSLLLSGCGPAEFVRGTSCTFKVAKRSVEMAEYGRLCVRTGDRASCRRFENARLAYVRTVKRCSG